MASAWWIAYKTGTKDNPVIVSTAASGAQYTSFSDGNPTVINGVSYTVTTAGGPYSSKAAAQAGLSRITKAAGGPPPSHAQTTGWIVVPEGAGGNVVNYLSKIGDAAKNPASLSADLGALTSTLQNASGNASAVYTVQELTTAEQVVGAQNAGIKVYATQAEAQAAAGQKNQSGGWEQAVTNFLTALTSQRTWLRAAKIIVGGAVLIVGISHITGMDNAVGNLARKAPLPI